MLATTLEVAVKTHIVSLEPANQWLLDKLQSPPIYRLYKDYLPILYVRKGLDPNFWPKLKSLFVVCQELFEVRNALAHGGSAAILSHDRHETFFEVASDLLYLLDIMSGHEWAKEYLSAKTCDLLGLPVAPTKRAYAVAIIHDL